MRHGETWQFAILRTGGPVKKFASALMFLLVATGFAIAKNWQSATIIGVSDTTVTSPMMREPKVVMHYTVLTTDWTLFLDYTYHKPTKSDEPDMPGKNSPPSVPVGEPTKISIEGHHAYMVDASGKEVKMDIKKKKKN
jgi:hypothetical protein